MRLPNPPGFSATHVPNASAKNAAAATDGDPQAALKLKKAWEMAWAPAKSIPMNAIMMWMAGNGVQIFSIMITAMMLMQPLKALVGIQAVFAPFMPADGESAKSSRRKQGQLLDPLLMPKVTFGCLQLVILAIGVYKCQSMGLLPTATSDWLPWMDWPTVPITAMRAT